MAGSTKIKVLLFLFVVYAVYAGHKKFFDSVPEKVANVLPSEIVVAADNQPKAEAQVAEEADGVDLKFAVKDDGAGIQNWATGFLNKVLDNPNGRLILGELLNRMLVQKGDMTGYDLLTARYFGRDTVVGTGLEAVCGDTVDVLYRIGATAAQGGENLDVTNGLKATFVLGSRKMPSTLEAGIVGMKEGGARSIVYQTPEMLRQVMEEFKEVSKANDGAPKLRTVTAKVVLQSVTKRSSANMGLGRSFFGKPKQSAIEAKLICADKVEGTYALTKLDGAAMYDSAKDGKKVSLVIGERASQADLADAIVGLSALNADVSFVATLTQVKQVFMLQQWFLPASVVSFKDNYPVILSFKLSTQF